MLFEKYSEDDYEAVCDFLIELNRADRSHINWNWARFEWMYSILNLTKEAYHLSGCGVMIKK